MPWAAKRHPKAIQLTLVGRWPHTPSHKSLSGFVVLIRESFSFHSANDRWFQIFFGLPESHTSLYQSDVVQSCTRAGKLHSISRFKPERTLERTPGWERLADFESKICTACICVPLTLSPESTFTPCRLSHQNTTGTSCGSLSLFEAPAPTDPRGGKSSQKCQFL